MFLSQEQGPPLNSAQILAANLEIVRQTLDLAAGRKDQQVARRLVENALGDCVSAFDGFGRETCRIHAAKATKPAKAEDIHFQGLRGARDLSSLSIV